MQLITHYDNQAAPFNETWSSAVTEDELINAVDLASDEWF
jgi:hypothetical protein